MESLKRFGDGVFEAVFNNAKDAFIVLREDGILLDANERALEFLGSDPDIINKKFTNPGILQEDSIRAIDDLIQQVETSVEDQVEVRFRDGRTAWARFYLTRVQEGKDYLIILMITDITILMGNGESGRNTHRGYRMVVENLHEGLGIMDRNDNFLYANPALAELLGHSQEKLAGMNIADIVPDEEVRIIRELTERRKSGSSEKTETTIIRSDGEMRKILFSGTPWFDDAGSYRGYAALFLDITENKLTEKALKESEEKYRATVEQSAENIYIYDIETRKIVESNMALQKLLGYSAVEMKGLRANDFVAHSDLDISEKIESVLSRGQAMIGERTYKRKDGTLVDVEVSASRINRGERKMLCVVSRDITERKKHQQSLVEERNRAEFYLDLLAHDMGNILHGIKSGLDALELVKGDRKKEDETLTLVHSLADRSTKLAKDVTKLSRIREQPKVIREINLKGIIGKSLEMALEGFPDADPEVHLNVDDDLVLEAEEIIEEAFYNLFHNSLKVQENCRPFIGVDATQTTNAIEIEVWDHGGGMSSKMNEELFSRYSNPIKKMHAGIGMTIVHMVVRRYGGSIDVSDRVENNEVVGSTFTLKFPRV
jgi:PAS domain S-box-containing protein